MRPIANFTVHAILAAAIAAIAATSAAAGPTSDGTTQHYFTITLQEGRVQQGSKGQQLHVQSYQWGTAKMQPGGGGGSAGMVMKGSRIGENSAAPSGGVSVASGDVNDAPGGGAPTGKRQHKPVTVAAPLDKGSVWIRVASPWAGCRVGARYPSLTLAGNGKRYQLQDVTVASCGGTSADRPTEEVAFYYNRIAFSYGL